jgi:phage terminase large subunit
MPTWNAMMNPKINTVVCAAHRRFGKDELALQATTIAAMQRTGSYLYALPQYSQARKALWAGINARTGRTRIDDAVPPDIIKKKDDKSMLVELVNGSTIQLVGSDQPDSLVGAGIVGYVASEAALSNPAAFSFIRPMLLETNGWSMHISSPRGKNSFYKLMEAHRNNHNSFITTLSANDTGVFTPAQLKQERHEYIQEHGVAMGAALFEQEYLCSFEAARIGGVWTAELIKLKKQGRYGPCQYDPRYPVDTSWDLGVRDPTVILFWQNVGTETRLIDIYESTDNGLEHYAQALSDKGYYYGDHWGPHDIQNREWGTGTSRMEQAARLGINFKRVPNTPKDDQISLGSQLINRLIINSTPDLDSGEATCERAIECFEEYHYEYDEVRKVASNKPVHNWASHCCDALMTYACAKARDVGFARPQMPEILQHGSTYPRVSDIMRRQTKQTGSMWG